MRITHKDRIEKTYGKPLRDVLIGLLGDYSQEQTAKILHVDPTQVMRWRLEYGLKISAETKRSVEVADRN